MKNNKRLKYSRQTISHLGRGGPAANKKMNISSFTLRDKFEDTPSDKFEDTSSDKFEDTLSDKFEDTSSDNFEDTSSDKFDDTSSDTFENKSSITTPCRAYNFNLSV